jgi:uncharacterized protein DUF993
VSELTVALPVDGGGLLRYRMRDPVAWPAAARFDSRVAYAAARVVADPLAGNGPGAPASIDWDATLAHRRRLWASGFAVAEAMDTAQRGMGLDWPAAAELIRRSGAEAAAGGAVLACGVGTDHAAPELASADEVVAAYVEQLEVVAAVGARAIVMGSRQLARLARHQDDYATVYGKVLSLVDQPAILHWLGPMFDPQLAGYWGSDDLDAATATLLDIVVENRGRIDGIKVSLLDRDREVRLRAALPPGVRLYTGDDFNYPELILGDGERHSDALLGIFDAIAPAAAAALVALDDGDVDRYSQILAPTVPLARHLFAAPTRFYKTGLTFLGWVAGQQDAFTMIGGQAAARSLPHLATAFRLADSVGLLPDAELAARRMRTLLALHGLDG